jgi:hypothetical protein
MYRYLRTTLITLNYIPEKMKSRLYWRQLTTISSTILSFPVSHDLSKNMKIKIYRIIILPVVLCGCGLWFFIPKGKAWIERQQIAERIRVFGRKREKRTLSWRNFMVKFRIEWE